MLIENAYYILTPTVKVSPDKIEEMSAFINSLKSIPIVLDYEKHDYITGTISHLPHLLAAGLVNYVKDNDECELMKLLAAGGFKDITRIASSSPAMWQQICLENSDNIAKILEGYILLLEQTKAFVENKSSQELYDLFASSRDFRGSIPDSSAGPIKKAFVLYCDIADVAGGIAAIATVLANGGINLKNIGIVHNREFEEGVLRIEFYESKSASKAAKLLQEHKYVIYER
jgi:prephenate dehydrogenase